MAQPKRKRQGLWWALPFNFGVHILRFQYEIIKPKPLITAIMSNYQAPEISEIPQYHFTKGQRLNLLLFDGPVGITKV